MIGVAWGERSREEANLFNPAFLALLLRQTASGFVREAGVGLPVQLAFLAVPLLLHRRSREALPYNTRSDLMVWLSEHPEVRFLANARTIRIRPFVQEAILFGVSHGVVTISSDGAIAVGEARVVKSRLDRVERSAGTAVKAAEKLGRWIARNGEVAYQLSLWGVVP